MIRVHVDAQFESAFRGFVEQSGLAVAFTGGENADLTILPARDRDHESTGTTLYAGGRISCPVACTSAERLEIPLLTFGAMLDRLEIKIRGCALGCFR